MKGDGDLVDIERSLGLRSERGVEREKDLESLPLQAVLKSIKAHSKDYLTSSINEIRTSSALRSTFLDLFTQYGPRIWPPPDEVRPRWLMEPSKVDGSPVIICQMSRLRGCIVLLLLMSHQVCDPVTVVMFVVQWADFTSEVEKAMLEGRSSPVLPEPFDPEIEDRMLLSPKFQGYRDCKPLELKQFVSINGLDPTKALAWKQSLFAKSYIPTALYGRSEQLWRTTVGIWKFPPSKLYQLRDIVGEASQDSSKPPTELDIITSFLWQRFFVAKYRPSENSCAPQTSYIVYAGDDKTSLVPTSRSTLGTSLLSAIEAIREPLDEWDESKYMQMLAESSQGQSIPGWIPRGPLEFIFSDHSRAGIVFSSSWGEKLGQVGVSREPYLGRSCPAGEVTVMPRLATGDLEVRISGEVATMERLLGDELMREFCPNVFLLRPCGKVNSCE